MADTRSRLRLLRRTPPRNLAHSVDETLRVRTEPSARLALGSGHAARGTRLGLLDLLALVLVLGGLAVGWQLTVRLGGAALPLAALLAAVGGGLFFRRRLLLLRVAAALAFALTVTALAGLLAG